MTSRAPSLVCLRALRAITAPEARRRCLLIAPTSSVVRFYATTPPSQPQAQPTPTPVSSSPNDDKPNASTASSTTPPPNTTTTKPAPPAAAAAAAAAAALQYTGRPKPTAEPRPDLLDPAAKDTDDPIPRPLARPIGVPIPPQAGENSGVDSRSWKQRRDDFVDYEKHIARRQKLASTLYRPYFRDFSAMRHFKGKTFLANERLFRAEQALWFPNLRGLTLEGGAQARDTTPVLQGKVSVLTLYSSAWGEHQVKSFVDETQNPGVAQLLSEYKDVAQGVEVNVEPNTAKWWLVRAFMYRLRAVREKAQWGRYFVVKSGVDEELRTAIGALNSRVGYTYLLDRECKIRWAGSAQAMEDEKESLLNGLRKLAAEARAATKATTK